MRNKFVLRNHTSHLIAFGLSFVFIILFTTNILGATITSTGTGGNWSAGGTWVGGNAPLAGDDVVIASGATVSVNANVTCASLTITGTLNWSGNKSLTVNGIVSGSGTIAGGTTNPTNLLFGGNWTFNGTITGNKFSPTANGTANQQITGIFSCNSFIITGSGIKTISTTAATVNTTINSGTVLEIASNGAFTTTGTLTNNVGSGGLVVRSGGSLIELSGVAATIERSIPANEWHLISSPVSGAVSGMFIDQYLQTHNETTNSYTDITSLVTPLEVMKGYALWTVSNPYTASFTGNVNTAPVTALSYTTTKNGAGWNLVGNPFPSRIDWLAAAGWTKTNVNNATYIHVNSSTWAQFVAGVGTNGGSRYIAPCQGFFVSATATGTLGMTNDVRVHNAATFYKNTEETIGNFVRLQVSGNNYNDEAVVRFVPEATNDFDGDFDAYKINGDVAEAAQIYTLGSIPLAINALPEPITVPLGIHAGVGTYTIAATELVDIHVLALEDTKTGIFTDLIMDGPYTFDVASGDEEVRFMLHFGTTSVPENELTLTNIYSYQKTVYIDLKDQAQGDIFIYNTAGQMVSKHAASQGMNEIKLQNAGIYMVKVVTAKSTTTKKVWIE